MTKEHIKYLKKIKRNNLLVKITQFSILILFIIIWQLLSDYKIINTFIFSSPKKVIECLISLHNANNLYNHIFITVYETFISFLSIFKASANLFSTALLSSPFGNLQFKNK